MHSSTISFLCALALSLSATAASAVNSERDLIFAESNVARGVAGAGFDKRRQRGGKGRGGKAGNKGAKGGNGGNAGNNGNKGGNTGGGSSATTAPPATAEDPTALQSSLQISPSVVQSTDDGQNPAVKGQTAASTSPNNFANLCASTINKIPLTNGLQITTGSCNPIPIGYIPSINNMVSSKFQSPVNGATIPAGETFNVVLKTVGMQIGSFSNAQKTYFGNPQTLNAKGQIIGHTHVVIESIPDITTTAITNAQNFVFFKGVNDPNDANNEVTVPVANGLKPGAYRMCTITSSLTHQPVIMPVAQHGSCDDCIYFNAAAGGGNATASAGGATAGAANTGKAATATGGKAAKGTTGAATKGGKAAPAKAQPAKAAPAKAAPAKAAPAKAAPAKAAPAKAAPAKAAPAKAKNGGGKSAGKSRQL